MRGATAPARNFPWRQPNPFPPAGVGGALQDGLDLLGGIVVEPFPDSEPRQQGGAQQTRASGRANEGEAGKIQTDTSGIRPWSMMISSFEILHRGIEVFLNRLLESVNLVDEQDVAFLQEFGQESGKVRRLFQGGTTGCTQSRAHRTGKNIGQCRLP